jgi:hypothetical protein
MALTAHGQHVRIVQVEIFPQVLKETGNRSRIACKRFS